MNQGQKKALRKIIVKGSILLIIIIGFGTYFYSSFILPKKNKEYFTPERTNAILNKEVEEDDKIPMGYFITMKGSHPNAIEILNNLWHFKEDSVLNYMYGNLYSSFSQTENPYVFIDSNTLRDSRTISDRLNEINVKNPEYSNYSNEQIQETREILKFAFENGYAGIDTLKRISKKRFDFIIKKGDSIN